MSERYVNTDITTGKKFIHRVPPPEYLTKAGAERLARKIEKYWRDQGRKVSATVYRDGSSLERNIFCVRTNLRDGLPS